MYTGMLRRNTIQYDCARPSLARFCVRPWRTTRPSSGMTGPSLLLILLYLSVLLLLLLLLFAFVICIIKWDDRPVHCDAQHCHTLLTLTILLLLLLLLLLIILMTTIISIIIIMLLIRITPIILLIRRQLLIMIITFTVPDTGIRKGGSGKQVTLK